MENIYKINVLSQSLMSWTPSIAPGLSSLYIVYLVVDYFQDILLIIEQINSNFL